MDRLKRFEYCREDLFLYIEKVLNLISPEKKEAFLNDKYVQIISTDKKVKGFQVTFNKPVASIIYINIKQVKDMCKNKESPTEEDLFIYGIAHEIAHYFVGECKSWILEKEADDWLKKWGDGNFDELIDKINYQAPKLEGEGYRDGYDWASKMDENDLIKHFRGDLESLNKDGLNKQETFKIKERIKNKLFNHLKKLNMLEDNNWDENHLNGFSFGVMERVRELADSE